MTVLNAVFLGRKHISGVQNDGSFTEISYHERGPTYASQNDGVMDIQLNVIPNWDVGARGSVPAYWRFVTSEGTDRIYAITETDWSLYATFQ